jgi:predicted CXXCH cytochrome family protein
LTRCYGHVTGLSDCPGTHAVITWRCPGHSFAFNRTKEAVLMKGQQRGLPLPVICIHRSGILRALGLLTGSLLVAAVASAQQQSGKTSANPYSAQYTNDGAAACLFCHDVERMRLITKTPHGDKQNPDTPFARHACESCHGPGSLHATRSRRGRGRPPMINYGVNTTTPPAKQAQSCLSNCHEKKMGKLQAMEWKGSVHGRPWEDETGKVLEMSCSNCHEIHAEHDPMEDKAAQAKVCYSCHKKAEKEHPRFEDAAVAFDKLSCWDCHDVHQLIPPGQ